MIKSTHKTDFILGFDFGTKTIGASVGQMLTQSAQALTPIKASDGIPNWQDIEKLIKEWNAKHVVVGLPLNMDGSDSELTIRARKFANRIHGRFGISVECFDERLSSFEAKGEIINHTGSRNFKQHNVDSISARLILESWLNHQANL